MSWRVWCQCTLQSSRSVKHDHKSPHLQKGRVPGLVLQEGRLQHHLVKEIWSEYPQELHEWMLRLTEIFDLTFPLTDRAENVVPCLLPPTEPEVNVFYPSSPETSY